jgi:hypothetical protein
MTQDHGSAGQASTRERDASATTVTDMHGEPTTLSALVREMRPGIVRGLFAGTALDKARSFEDFVRGFGDLEAEARTNYMEHMLDMLADTFAYGVKPRPNDARKLTITQYLAEILRDPASPTILSEQHATPELVQKLELPPLLRELGIAALTTNPRPAPDQAGVMWFMANAGNANDLHMDWHGHHVLNHNIAGKKRWILFPPSAAARLQVVEIYGTVRLRGMPDDERRRLVEELGGDEIVLDAGETIYFPPFYLHHVEYLEHALSLGLRFEPPRSEIKFLLAHLHRSPALENIYFIACRDPARTAGILEELRSAYELEHRNPVAKYHAIEALATSWCKAQGLLRERWWISPARFLDDLFAMKYARPNPRWGRLKSWWWQTPYLARLALRSVALRLTIRA